MDNDLQVLRQRSSDRIIRTDRLILPDPVTTPRILVRTVSGGSYPTATGKYYLCNPVSISGSESENGTGTLTADTSITIPVLLVRGVPPAGTDLVARSIGGRWVSEYKAAGGGGVITTCCGSISLPSNPTCTYAHYNISNVLDAGPATVGMNYLSEVAFSGCTSRGPGFRTTAPLDPAIYAFGGSWDGLDRYLVFRCNVGSLFEMRIITPFSNCFYGPTFNPISTCSPFFAQGNDAAPGLSPYTKYTLTP